MQISVPGQSEQHRRQQGFSLLEVLIVLTIIGITTTMVGVGVFSDGDARMLREDAVRLTQLFALAQTEARKGGSPVVWEYDTQGYGFARAPRDIFLPTGIARLTGPAHAELLNADSALRRRAWTSDNAVVVRVDPPATNVFNTEWISGPLRVELDDGRNTVEIYRSGSGVYRVGP